MRVLVVTNDLPPQVGGIEYYVDQLCRGLAAAGDEVTVLASESPGWRDWDATAPYRVVREPATMLLPTPGVLRHSLRLVDRYRPEVVVFGAAAPLGLLGPSIRSRTGVPYVAFTHGLEVSAARMPGVRRALRVIGRDAAAVTYVSHWCADLLRPSFGPGPLHELLPPAVDPGEFNPSVDGAGVRRRLGIGDEPVVVCVSRLVERKGQDTLIAVLPELRRRVPGARLLLVGPGPHREELEQRARRTGVADDVVFTGGVPDEQLAAHFAAGDVFAMPCRERHGGLEVEAFGIVLIQAQAIGRPVVAGRTGGVPDALDDGTTGLLVDPTSDAAVLEGIAALLGDPERATRMGAAAARWAGAGFTWERRTAELRDLLGRVARVEDVRRGA